MPVKDANVNSINKYSAVPSVLIEAGFMTNEADLEAIQIPENQSELAKRVADAVVAYRNIYIDDIEAPELESMEISGNPSYTAEFWAQAVNVTDASGVKDVEFRIWNESLGINKARWYDGVQNGSNWKVEASAEEFENTPGKYYIEAVATDIYGNRASIGMMVIDVMHLNELPPKMMDITMEQTVYDPEVTVDALVYDKDGIAGINVAVWSETNGQDDIKWFKATNKGNDTWGLTVDLAAAPYNLKADNYYFELHATDKLGYYDCIGETVITLG